MSIETLSEHAAFGGTVGFYRHASAVTNCEMQFSVFVPPQARSGPVPMLTWLSGLTCTEETFMIKSGAQRIAAELGVIIVNPDTSPRGDDVPDDPDGSWDFGIAAGFYLNATQDPWSRHYRMYEYVVQELQALALNMLPVDRSRQGIFGHSMGGHGALTIGLKHPDIYRSISAFAPIGHPSACPWGEKAFGNYLGSDKAEWADYDATELARRVTTKPENPILVDQGMADQFLDEQLRPDDLAVACADAGIELELRRHDGYDHGYYFISTFMEDHLRHHARCLTS